MGVVFSRRIGSDPYYLSYEKAFDKIAAKEQAVQARRYRRSRQLRAYADWGRFGALLWGAAAAVLWGTAQKTGDVHKLLGQRYWSAVVLSVAGPVILALLAMLISRVQAVIDARDAVYLKRLLDSRRKMLKELKDSTHFDRTMALLRKYDPDAQPTPQKAPTPQRGGGQVMPAVGYGGAASTPASQLLMKTSTMAVAAATGAGKALFPVFDTLANNMIGDNPLLVAELRRAKEDADRLRHENGVLRERLAKLGGHDDLLGPLLLPASPIPLLEGPRSPHGMSGMSEGEQQVVDGPALQQVESVPLPDKVAPGAMEGGEKSKLPEG